MASPVTGLQSRIYARYYYNNTNQSSILPGVYSAWATSIYGYTSNTTFGTEWPPSGAFDKLAAISQDQPGWHIQTGDFVGGTYAPRLDLQKNIYLQLPRGILLSRYNVQIRLDGYLSVAPSAWVVYGSNDEMTWDVLDIRSDIGGWTLGGNQTFTVGVPRDTYSVLRFMSYHVMNLAEIRYFGSLE